MRFSLHNRNLDRFKLYLKIIIPVILLIIMFVFIIKHLEPAFWSRIESYAIICAESAVNNAVAEVLDEQNIKYNDLVILNTNPEGKISSLEIDSLKMNVLKSQLSEAISESIKSSEKGKIYLNLGTISGSPLFSGVGPKICIKIFPANQTKIDFKDSLTESGINQVKHKIYLDVSVNLNITTALSQKTTNYKTTIPIADTVIVGVVPNYYGISGLSIAGDEYGTYKE